MNIRRSWVAMTLAAVAAAVAAWFILVAPLGSPTVPTRGVATVEVLLDPESPGSEPRATAITLPPTLDAGQPTAATARPYPRLRCRVGTPARLVIPALRVNAPFERIGLDRQAEPDPQGKQPLGNPNDRTNAGWYADGPRPGSGKGTVLTNGHTYRDGSAIFTEDFASTIRVGQLIHVVQTNTSVCSYRVQRVWPEVNSKRDFPRIVASERLYNFEGPERLFLATCGGSWNSATQNYDDISLLVATPINRG